MEIPAKYGFCSLALAGCLGLVGCGGGSVSRPTQPSISQTASLVNDVDISYRATLQNASSASRTVKHDGTQMYTDTISFSPYNETLEKQEKGKWDFELKSGSLSDIDFVTVPNYNPSFNSAGLETNLNEAYEGSSKTFNLETRILDKNPEDGPVPFESARSLDGKTVVGLDGYNLTVKANGVGPYQVEVNFGSDSGGRSSSILSGNITAVPEQFAFWSDKDHGAGELYTGSILNGKLTNVKRVTNNRFNDVNPAWSVNGKELIFVSNRDLGLLGLYLMDNFDGTDQAKKLTPNGISATTPTWCTDGKIYFGFVDYDFGKTGIGRINPDGTGFIRLVEEPFSGTLTGNPSCSPSGLEFAFSTSRDGNSEVYIANLADGSNQRNLTNNLNGDSQPRWSLDNKISFMTDRDTPGAVGELNLYLTNPDGTGLQRLTNFPGREMDLSWSSDLTKFLFTKVINVGDPFHIYLINNDGTGLTQITTDGQNIYPAFRPR